MLPSFPKDVTTLATATQVLQALTSLAGLPSRQADDPEMDKQTYHVGLHGVTRYALAEAVKAVHRNALGHPFFPKPSELRKLCDDAQRPIDNQRRREGTKAETEDDWQRYTAIKATHTPEVRARVSAVYDRFCDGYRKEEPFVSKLDPELLAKVPDAPKRAPEGFKQARVA